MIDYLICGAAFYGIYTMWKDSQESEISKQPPWVDDPWGRGRK